MGFVTILLLEVAIVAFGAGAVVGYGLAASVAWRHRKREPWVQVTEIRGDELSQEFAQYLDERMNHRPNRHLL